jgi:hypothetical protein
MQRFPTRLSLRDSHPPNEGREKLTSSSIQRTNPPVRRSGGRGGGYALVEESPGSTVKRRRVTPARGDPRDSATESKPPASRGR